MIVITLLNRSRHLQNNLFTYLSPALFAPLISLTELFTTLHCSVS